MKKLVSADTIRQARAAGQSCLFVPVAEYIITPEAKGVARELGVELTLTPPCPCAAPAQTAGCEDAALKTIRDGVLAHFPAGSLSSQMVDELVKKALIEAAKPAALYESHTGAGGIKVIRGNTVRYERFDGAGAGTNVKIVDVVTGDDNSSMAAGFMEWDNLFFPWTLTYDEVDIVLEGELHIRHKGETFIGRVGDVLFIPKNSAIEFGTPTHTRFLFVAFPANWQDA